MDSVLFVFFFKYIFLFLQFVSRELNFLLLLGDIVLKGLCLDENSQNFTFGDDGMNRCQSEITYIYIYHPRLKVKDILVITSLLFFLPLYQPSRVDIKLIYLLSVHLYACNDDQIN